jgi:hypothetical protein
MKMNVLERYPDAQVSPIPSVECFAPVLLAQSNACSAFDRMEISPQHRSIRVLSIRGKTDTDQKEGNCELVRFVQPGSFTGVL